MSGIDARKGDITIGIAILAGCAFMAWRTVLVRVPPSSSVAGPSFMPWIVITGLVVLSLALIVRALIRMGAAEGQDVVEIASRSTMVRMGLFALLMVAYAAAFMAVGYILSTLVAFVFGLVLFGERRPLVLIALPAAATSLIYYVFSNFLNVWLP